MRTESLLAVAESDHEESFNNLHVYLHNLRRTNTHTYTHIDTDLMDRFQACFVAIGWIHAFIGCFLPIIFIGSVRLRGDYLKTMFVAVAMDGNKQTLPIAFGLAVENNLYCCTWFLMRLKEALRQGREVSFITNMDDVVSSCIEHVFPDSYHVYTPKSVYTYMRTSGLSGRTLQPLFWMTSNSYTVSDFEENFRRLSRVAREVLANIGYAKWARAYFPNIRWNVVDIDVPQFLLVLLLNQRNVPIITLTESIRDYIQRTFVERSLLAGSLTTVFTPYAEMVLH